MLFVNGLPLGVIELKNPADEEADIWTAWQQLQTYKAELPSLFSMNELLVVSDGTEARLGTLTAGQGVVQAVAHYLGRGPSGTDGAGAARAAWRASARRSGCSR